MDMSADLESMGKNMYAHCDADNSTSKNNFKNTIDSKMEDMQGYFDEYKKQPMTDREKEYFGAMTDKFSKYKDGMDQVLDASSKGDNPGAMTTINVIQKPAEDYLSKKIESLISMRKDAMNSALLDQQKTYLFARNFCHYSGCCFCCYDFNCNLDLPERHCCSNAVHQPLPAANC